MGRNLVRAVFLVLVLAGAGCAGAVHRDAATAAAEPANFDGTWSTQWCDRTRPDLDCGGFRVTLVQKGDTLCGDFSGALVDLRQVDEGDLSGRVEDGVALLDVRSGRNGSVVRVRATRIGANLHWKDEGTVREGGSDISVIALDDVLETDPSRRQGTPKACLTPPS
ncbi:hypothetical protein [Luteimonas sp. SDU101]|uniref:hypothetical protein n=1 Tax=Luteimonas sp. SDU101 TaxID=3422593 RepID=UPI003EB9AE49